MSHSEEDAKEMIVMIDSEEDAKETNVMIDAEEDAKEMNAKEMNVKIDAEEDAKEDAKESAVKIDLFHAAAHVNVDVNVEMMMISL